MSMKHFIKEVEKGLESPVYFLYADDPFLLKEASVMGAGIIPEGERAFSVTVFDLDSIDETPPLEQILDVANTPPFMAGKRVVAIENVQELAKKDMGSLEAYVSNPFPSTILILLHQGNPKAQWKDLMKKTKAVLLDIRQQDLPFWIKEKARQKGLDITQNAIEYLLGMIGPDVGLISSELEKFTLIGKSFIDTGDIAPLVRSGSDYDVFDLVNALRDKDAKKVFRVAKNLQETQEPYGLLGAINWHYTRMSSGDKGRTSYYDRVFQVLNEADVRIKTSGGTFPLEYLLIRLLRI
jgi:DNA polymerase-3 subunit delta